jgi:hypothetical protein
MTKEGDDCESRNCKGHAIFKEIDDSGHFNFECSVCGEPIGD